MDQAITISILNILDLSSPISINNERSDINDPEIVEEALKYVGKAGYRRITDILLFVIPNLIKQNILNQNNPIIHVRISGDGQIGRASCRERV